MIAQESFGFTVIWCIQDYGATLKCIITYHMNDYSFVSSSTPPPVSVCVTSVMLHKTPLWFTCQIFFFLWRHDILHTSQGHPSPDKMNIYYLKSWSKGLHKYYLHQLSLVNGNPDIIYNRLKCLVPEFYWKSRTGNWCLMVFLLSPTWQNPTIQWILEVCSGIMPDHQEARSYVMNTQGLK